MSQYRKRKKRSTGLPLDSGMGMDLAIKRHLRVAAGAETLKDRDPVSQINEDFRQTFDFIGSRASGRQEARSGEQHRPSGESKSQVSDRQTGQTGRRSTSSRTDTRSDRRGTRSDRRDNNEETTDSGGFFADRTDARDIFRSAQGSEDSGFASRFSQTAFNRGDMSGAVLRGTGDIMLLSCLKRTVGQSGPKNFRQRMLFSSGASVKQTVKGRPQTKAVFNRDEVDGAVGLVVDTLNDARASVDALSELASGENILTQGSGTETLLKQYPFLSDEKERGLLKKYEKARAQLVGPEAAERREILERAYRKTQAMIDKKSQMRFNFIQHLRFISSRAQKAADIFEDETVREELLERLKEYSPGPQPPDGGGGDYGKGDEGGSDEEEKA